jgi:hypothetical protein
MKMMMEEFLLKNSKKFARTAANSDLKENIELLLNEY